MENKYIEELTKEELTKVFEANHKLQNDVYDDMIDSEMHWIGEQLDYLRDGLSDWSIGAYNHNYIRVRDNSKFIDGLIKMDKEVPLFSDEDAKQIYAVEKLRDELYEKDVDDEDYDEVEEGFEEMVHELAEEVTRAFTKRLDNCAERQYQLEYFLEFYVESRLEKDLFYIKDDSYELFEDVAFTKSYKN